MKNNFISIDFKMAKEIMDNEEKFLILDVREEEEYITGHADSAELLPVDAIDYKSAKEIIPSKNTPVMVYCRTGSRSRLAAEKLCELGYKRVYDLGSLAGWPYGISYC